MWLLLLWPVLAILAPRLGRRLANGLALFLWGVAASAEIGGWICVPPDLVVLLVVLQALGACVVFSEAPADVAPIWLSCALQWMSLEQTQGTTLLSASLGTLVLLVGLRLGGRAGALAGFTLSWALQYFWESRGILLVLHPLNVEIPGVSPSLPVDAAAFTLCGLAVLALTRLVSMPTWAFSLTLAASCLTFSLEQAPVALGVMLLGSLLALRRARPVPARRAWVVLVLVLVGPTVVREQDALQYSLRYPGNGRPDRAASAEGLRMRQHYALSRLAEGSDLTPSQLGQLLPRGLTLGRVPRINRPALDVWPARLTRLASPAWMFFSNNPEVVPPSPSPVAVLMRADVGAGDGRIFISHFNFEAAPRSLVLQFSNSGSMPCRLRHLRDIRITDLQATLCDVGTTAWQGWMSWKQSPRVDALAPGESLQDVIPALHGNGLVMADVACDQPLRLSVGMISGGPEEARQALDSQEVVPLRGAQQRGVFPLPDEAVDLDGSLDDGHLRAAMLSLAPLPGVDPATGRDMALQGSYGAISHVRVTLHRKATSPWHRALLLLVPVGGSLGSVQHGATHATSCFGAVVLYNRMLEEGDEARYEWSLPANSYGPVALVLVPLKR